MSAQSPRFLRNHHQWLKKFGRDKIHDQIERVITIMKLSAIIWMIFEKNSHEYSRKAQRNYLFSILTFSKMKEAAN
jgi:hypothetical protein